MRPLSPITREPETQDSPTFELLGVIRAHSVIVVLTTVLAAAAGIATAFLMTPVYRSTTLLMPAQANDRMGGLSGMLGQLGGGIGMLSGLGLGGANETVTTEAIALLRSRAFLEQFIARNNLMPKLFPKQWDAQKQRWKPNKEPPTPWKAYKKFVDGVMDVYQDKKTNLVTLSIDWTNREEGAAWANELVDRVNEQVRQRAIADADQTIGFLQAELKKADTMQLQSAIYTMMESQVKIKAVATVRQQYAFQVLDPAAPADPDVMLRPRRVLYSAAGPVIGFVLGTGVALLMDGRRRRRVLRPVSSP